MFPALGIALVPGAAVALNALPSRTWPLTEFIVVAFGASIALIQVLTIAAMTLHFGPMTTIAVLLGGSALLLGFSALNPKQHVAIAYTASEIGFWAMVIALACLLYVEGSPYSSGEDYLHLSVIRRLAMKNDPALDNIYFVPGVIYTYPFPGIHYLNAVISRLGDLDPVFVYHKLRFLWATVALASLCVVASRIFGSSRVGLASGFTALLFVFSGTFAVVPPLIWGQLAPYSHASDVALGVLVPLTIAYLVMFFDTEDAREAGFFFAGTLGLVVMVTIVHVRELIQILVYLAAFTMYLLWTKAPRAQVVRPAAVLVVAMAIGGIFTLWSNAAIAHIGTLVVERREQLVQTVRDLSLVDLLRPPLPIFSGFVAYYSTLFWGWIPVLLIATPFALRRYQDRWLVGLLGSSILCYLLIIRFPLFAFPYIYFTYFEILFTPLRNIVFFLQVAAGAVVYVLTDRMSKASARTSIVLAAAVCIGCGLLFQVPRSIFDFLQDILIVPAIALFAWFVIGARRGRASQEPHLQHVTQAFRFERAAWRWAVAGAAVTAAAVLVVVFQLTAKPAPVIHVRWADDVSASSRVIHEFLFNLANGERLEGRSWSYDAIDPSITNMRAVVTSPAVKDTHEVNRDTFEINPTAPRSRAGVWAWSEVPILGNPEGLSVLVIALIGVALFSVTRATMQTSVGRLAARSQEEEPHPRPWLFVATSIGLAIVGWMPNGSVLASSTGVSTPADAIAALRCGEGNARLAPFAPEGVKVMVTPRVSCAPNLDMIQWVSANVPVDAVFIANTENQYLPSAFLPQQFLGWYGLDRSFLNPELLFGDYLRFYRQSLKAHGAQPFFNDRETSGERLALVKALKVTHVLVDPAFHDSMIQALAADAAFEKVFDDHKWAVFRVVLTKQVEE